MNFRLGVGLGSCRRSAFTNIYISHMTRNASISVEVEQSKRIKMTEENPEEKPEPLPWDQRLDELAKIMKNSRPLNEGKKIVSERSAIFLSLDLEMWERQPSRLTEIGLAIYDPTDQPPNTSKAAFPVIKAGHYIVKENFKCYNGRFVPDHKCHFSYGQSLVLSIKDCRRALEDIVEHYKVKARQENRTLMLVGHDVKGDVTLLRRNGFKFEDFKVIDTLSLWKANPSAEFGALAKVLKYLNIPHGLLHNAGNDAYLTLQLMLCLCDTEYRKLKDLDGVIGPPAEKGKRRPEKTSRDSTAEEAVNLFIS
jgi:DNA polymerase III epsilon subunit-like protein